MEPIAQTQRDRMIAALSPYVGKVVAASIVKVALQVEEQRGGADPSTGRFLESVGRGLKFFCADERAREQCLRAVKGIFDPGAGGATALPEGARIAVRSEGDIVGARRTARLVAASIGFDDTDQAKITTAVSELARNIHRYAGAGEIDLTALKSPRAGIRIVAQDSGPGISDVQSILAGGYKSKTGLGLGILGCKRLMDDFAIDSAPGRGTCVTLAKYVRGAL